MTLVGMVESAGGGSRRLYRAASAEPSLPPLLVVVGRTAGSFRLWSVGGGSWPLVHWRPGPQVAAGACRCSALGRPLAPLATGRVVRSGSVSGRAHSCGRRYARRRASATEVGRRSGRAQDFNGRCTAVAPGAWRPSATGRDRGGKIGCCRWRFRSSARASVHCFARGRPRPFGCTWERTWSRPSAGGRTLSGGRVARAAAAIDTDNPIGHRHRQPDPATCIHVPAVPRPDHREEGSRALGGRASSRVDVRPRVQPWDRVPTGATSPCRWLTAC